ncbi:MAG: hypothetical protein KGH61_02320 [Candidatus Micrarchaeota archaeon]|nr:hypothetical protein [Candidatus Micrarchaeota archaeon]MDE1847763.1 hypothetical protein [Candidatus Micrarchaeota archaeon]MDE1863906.1 hypothetical protein [Candidatus Micrarchaeota archaeon]
MAGPDLTTTGIDALVDYLKAHGETEESKLATELKVSEKVIEEWSEVLEKAKMVKISYRVGRMFVALLVGAAAGDGQTLKSEIGVRKESLQSEVSSQLNLMQEFDKRIVDLSKVVGNAESLFKKNAGPIKKDLDDLDRIKKETEKHYSSIKEEKDKIDKMSSTLDTEMRALEEIAAKIQGFNVGNSEVDKVMVDVKAKVAQYREAVKDSEMGFEKMIREQRESFKHLHEAIFEEMKILNESLEMQKKQLGENQKLEKYAKTEAIKMKGEAERSKGNILNNLGKTKQSLDNTYPLMEKKIMEINAKAEEVKKGFGGLAQINSQIGAIKQEIEESKREHDELVKELNSLNAQAKGMEALKKSNEEKKAIVEDYVKKAAKTNERVQSLDKKIAGAKSKAEGLGAGASDK